MRWLAHLWLRIRGWKFEGTFPATRRFVVIGAPHTSNYDFIVFLAVLWHFRLKVSYLGKDTLFRWPLGILMRKLGGIPVSRDRPEGVVEAAVAAFTGSESLILVVAPESTRTHLPYWRSGFYRIAAAADVAILPAFVDIAGKRAGIGNPISPTGDMRDDMDRIRDYYASVITLPPDGMGPIRLRGEGETTDS
jgi:1-acyl-sn-glycerol-3-phosphate acyltransferase